MNPDPAPAPGPEPGLPSPPAPLISAGMLEDRVEFERGMSVFPLVSILLIAASIFCFVLEVQRQALTQLDALIRVGAKSNPQILAGEFWRLVSTQFLHGSAGHLLGNVFALYVLGMGCEHAYGRLVTFTAYIWTGILAAALSCVHPKVAVGASGAIFGLLGLLGTMLYRHRDRLVLRDKRTGFVLAVWAIYSIVLGTITPGVDNVQHAGGLLGGFLIGRNVQPQILIPPEERTIGLPILLASGATLAVLLYAARHFLPALGI